MKNHLSSFDKFKGLNINEALSEELENEASKAAYSLISTLEHFLTKLENGKVSKAQIEAVKEAEQLVKKVIKK